MGAPAYTDTFKSNMVRRLLSGTGESALDLSREAGVPRGTLYRWLRDVRASSTIALVAKKSSGPPPERPPRRSDDWTKKERLRVLLEASALSGEALGTLLRREGIHEQTLDEWRADALASLSQSDGESGGSARDRARIARLERELVKKDKRIEATEALLDLAKKVQALWGDAATDTTGENDK